MRIKSVDVYVENFPPDDVPDTKELENYVDFVNERVKESVKKITVKLCDDGKVDLIFDAEEKFERIRRITGCR